MTDSLSGDTDPAGRARESLVPGARFGHVTEPEDNIVELQPWSDSPS